MMIQSQKPWGINSHLATDALHGSGPDDPKSKNANFCRDPKFLVNLAGETPAATARITVNMLSV